jgi:hypothetical protein
MSSYTRGGVEMHLAVMGQKPLTRVNNYERFLQYVNKGLIRSGQVVNFSDGRVLLYMGKGTDTHCPEYEGTTASIDHVFADVVPQRFLEGLIILDRDRFPSFSPGRYVSPQEREKEIRKREKDPKYWL